MTITIQTIRAKIRSGELSGCTSGMMPDLVQGNVVILPKSDADEFVAYCLKNPKPCPIIGVSKAGDPSLPMLGKNIDIRNDIPEYTIFKQGVAVETVPDIYHLWSDEMTSVVLGCSFSFENELAAQGLTPKNVRLGRNVAMYETSIATHATARFSGPMVVSMRPYKASQIDRVIEITRAFALAHGEPIHIGASDEIGIKNLARPEYGEPVPLERDDIPVFWACGVTSQMAVQSAKLPLVITHSPGKMLITDRTYANLSVPITTPTPN